MPIKKRLLPNEQFVPTAALPLPRRAKPGRAEFIRKGTDEGIALRVKEAECIARLRRNQYDTTGRKHDKFLSKVIEDEVIPYVASLERRLALVQWQVSVVADIADGKLSELGL